MRLHFLGTGGARRVTATQKRRTAGTIIEGSETSIYLDPGPGSIVHCQNFNTEKIEGIIISHAHLDHYSDAEPVIELVSEYHENKCELIGPETVLEGYGDYQQRISNYHKNMCTTVTNLTEASKTEIGDLKVESQEMFHNEPKCRGLKVSDGDKKIGFWTDTAFSEELVEFYKDCDIIVINCPIQRGMDSRKHTTLEDVPEILKNLEASTAILTHFTLSFLESDIESQKHWLQEQVDQKIIFAQDEMIFPGDRKLNSF